LEKKNCTIKGQTGTQGLHERFNGLMHTKQISNSIFRADATVRRRAIKQS